jgi:serine/threonine protein kinase
VANELAVSAMLSSLVRCGICPNFIVMRGVFTAAYSPPESIWGCEEKKYPKGKKYVKNKGSRQPKTPENPEPGRYQYIRMELVNEGDTEELIKRQTNELLPTGVARCLLFQIAFSLYAAADKYSVKHYDVKLLNIFIQRVETVGDLVVRYGLGSHIFAIRMPASYAFIAKLADFGSANIVPASNGLPVAIAQFTTLENTPPDFMILGDDATQGHEHDSFGLGLGMLQLFTGSRPYEEILEDVRCPPNLKKRLRGIWENESVDGYSVIRSVIFDGVDKDEVGTIIQGDPDETFYDTLYRFLVLFGIPEFQFQQKTCPRVWKAISDSLDSSKAPRSRGGKRKKLGSDVIHYNRDCKKYSIRSGNNPFIARARNALLSIDGGMDLLLGLCAFDPKIRYTAMDVLNSTFMEELREEPGAAASYDDSVKVLSYTSFATQS